LGRSWLLWLRLNSAATQRIPLETDHYVAELPDFTGIRFEAICPDSPFVSDIDVGVVMVTLFPHRPGASVRLRSQADHRILITCRIEQYKRLRSCHRCEVDLAALLDLHILCRRIEAYVSCRQ